MEMTADSRPPLPPPYMEAGARLAAALVTAILDQDLLQEQDQVPVAAPESAQHAMAGATFLGQLIFAVQLSGGADPRAARELLAEPGRGHELARKFLASGTLEICCDYCGGLMLMSLAAAAAAQMTARHGPAAAAAWRALADAIMPWVPAGPQPAPESRPYLP